LSNLKAEPVEIIIISYHNYESWCKKWVMRDSKGGWYNVYLNDSGYLQVYFGKTQDICNSTGVVLRTINTSAKTAIEVIKALGYTYSRANKGNCVYEGLQ
jgi:hypothetical protein